jgi:hypothetical protein
MDRDAFPDDWVDPVTAPIHVVAGSQFGLDAQLRDASDEPVAWSIDAGAYAITPTAGAPTVAMSPSGKAVIVVDESTVAAVSLAVDDASWHVADVIGVPTDAPASLEIVVAGVFDANDGTGSPLGARAVVRDAAGTLLYATPVTWEVGGPFTAAGGVENDLPGPDYVTFDEPETQGGEQHATIRATYGDLTDAVEIRWVEAEPDGGPGCAGCANSSSPLGGLAAGLAGFLIARRRR